MAPIKIRSSLMKHAKGGTPAMLNADVVEYVAVRGICSASPPIFVMSRVLRLLMIAPEDRNSKPLLTP